MLAWVNVWGKALGGRLGVLAMALAPCLGGCIDDFDNPKGYGEGSSGSGTNSGYDCADLCADSERCGGGSDLDCNEQCDMLDELVRGTACSDELDDAFECLSRANDVCAAQQDACLDETEDFTSCIQDHCAGSRDDCGDY